MRDPRRAALGDGYRPSPKELEAGKPVAPPEVGNK